MSDVDVSVLQLLVDSQRRTINLLRDEVDKLNLLVDSLKKKVEEFESHGC